MIVQKDIISENNVFRIKYNKVCAYIYFLMHCTHLSNSMLLQFCHCLQLLSGSIVIIKVFSILLILYDSCFSDK